MPQFEWYRKPSNRSGNLLQSANIGIGAFIASFERLCLKDQNSNSNSDASMPCIQGEDCDSIQPFTVRPLPAPLPSLVQRPKKQSIPSSSGRDNTPRDRKRRPSPTVNRALHARPSQKALPLKSRPACSSPAISHVKRQSIVPRKTLHDGAQPTGDLKHSSVVVLNCSQPEGSISNTEGQPDLVPRLYGDTVSAEATIGESIPISSNRLSTNFTSASTVDSLQNMVQITAELPVSLPTLKSWPMGFNPDFDFLDAPYFTDLHSSFLQQAAGDLTPELWGDISVDGYRNHLLSF